MRSLEFYNKDEITHWGYDDLLKSFDYPILLQVDDNDYQGDSRVLFSNYKDIGFLVFGWGSCSGCDALQGCAGSIVEIGKLRQELFDSIIWKPRDEMREYLRTKDWEVEFHNSDETARFANAAVALLEDEPRYPNGQARLTQSESNDLDPIRRLVSRMVLEAPRGHLQVSREKSTYMVTLTNVSGELQETWEAI